MQEFTYCEYPARRPPVRIRLVTTDPQPCPYLPGRISENRAFVAGEMSGLTYHQFMDAGFRRSGLVVYQPVCRGCRACVPIRIPVAEFTLTKSQRRRWRKNGDLRITIAKPVISDEKFALYRRYMEKWHQRPSESSRESFEAFLYQSPVDTLEFAYRNPTGDLVAVGICDVCPRSLSSVYFYHDPAHCIRGLGAFGALYEIEFARSRNIAYYYLGYWVEGCRTMDYKADYHPHELLRPDGQWHRPVMSSC